MKNRASVLKNARQVNHDHIQLLVGVLGVDDFVPPEELGLYAGDTDMFAVGSVEVGHALLRYFLTID